MKHFFFEDFKESYYKEMERKESYNGKLGVLLTIYSLVSVPLLYCLNNFTKIKTFNIIAILIYVLIGVSILFYLISVSYALRAYWGHKYMYLPSPKKLDKFISDTALFFEANKEYFKEKNISRESYIDERKTDIMYTYYKDATTHNIKENDSKMKKINICTYHLAISVVLMLISCALLRFACISEEPTSVYIENEKIITEEVYNIMNDEETRTTNSNEQNVPPAPPPAPEMRVINENFSLIDIKENNKDDE